uniref:L1 transposable element RRM domain-containing protein n=1 Tax=Oreochromis niloticus TaxID=8128 RepID=A0A669E9G4_ORENI
ITEIPVQNTSSNLRKYKYEASSTAKTSAAAGKSGDNTASQTPKSAPIAKMDVADLKTDIITSLRQDIATIIQQEVRSALADSFDSLKRDIQDVKAEINSNTTAIRAELDQVRANVKSVEAGLSNWSDEMVAVQDTMESLTKEVKALKHKCEDFEGRMRRGNIRIIGVTETQGSSSPAAVSALLKEVFQLDREVRVERSHRSLTQRRPGDIPRPIIAKLNSEGDAADILRRARRGKLHFKGNPIAIFPDYTASVAKARAAFTDVRKILQDRPGVRFGILYPARFRVSYNNVEKEFVDAAKAMDYQTALRIINGTETARPAIFPELQFIIPYEDI